MSLKIAVIGCGAVGSSFIYSAIHNGLASEYGLLDYDSSLSEGQVLDLEDSTPYFPQEARLQVISDYSDLKNYDYLVITAGRAQKVGETRLQMIEDNSKIMKSIAEKVKSSGFQGITLICSNPVDVLTYVFLKVTAFSPSKVIGSGTVLDSSRLRIEISKNLKVSPSSIEGAYIIGEHGDSALATFSLMRIGGLSLNSCETPHYPHSPYCCMDYSEKLEEPVCKKAYRIIERKRATHFGIGAALSKILQSIIFDKNEILTLSTLTKGEYGVNEVVLSLPVVVNSQGIQKILEFPLKDKEKSKLLESSNILKQNIDHIRKLI